MLNSGILNPQILDLLARIRHTNTIVIADRGFPYWPTIETVDITLVNNIPTVLQVLAAIRTNFNIGRAWMAIEFQTYNSMAVRDAFAIGLAGIPTRYEQNDLFKQRVPNAIGLIRTADTVPYANIILESA
ncbi:MAG: RbsD/FucU family protein [Anaerolineales bacterium]|nr:RbsD/FucU family protein [Anaerolineales bacterium]